MKILILSLALIATLAAQEKSQESLKERIDALKAPKVAWRQIEWRTCLFDALKESREKKKPLILWVFIDRPVDDERC